MNLQISWANQEKTLSVQLNIRNGSALVFSFGHPVFGFLWHLCQGSLKGIHYLEPLRIVDDQTKEILLKEEEEVLNRLESIKPELLKQVEEGLKYYEPELCEEGVNGTYFLRDTQGSIIAVFKPNDEEGDSQNNPKRSEESGDFLNKGIPQGEGAIREVAAYILDNVHFSGVPQTIMVALQHPTFHDEEGIPITKIGSLQEFIENEGSCEDFGSGKFPIQEVHKIGILDMRILNNDRHGGNILMKRTQDGNLELVPIDHGFSLSSTLDRAWFEWLHWPQAKEPFDDKTKQFIERIDIEADAFKLQELGIQEEAIRTMIITTTLLKKGAALGLNLFQLGSMVCREELDQPSLLEKIVQESDGFEILFSRMDVEIAKLGSEDNCEIL